MNWCPHLVLQMSNSKQKQVWFFKDGMRFESAIVTEEWKACPICKVDRPEEPQKLAEKYEQMYLDKTIVSYEGHEKILKDWCNKLSQAAIDAVCEAIDEEVKKSYSEGHSGQIYAKELKPAIRKKLL